MYGKINDETYILYDYWFGHEDCHRRQFIDKFVVASMRAESVCVKAKWSWHEVTPSSELLPGVKVVEITRPLRQFFQALDNFDELADLQKELRENGMSSSPEGKSGYRILVPPAQYEDVKRDLDHPNAKKMRSRHIIASEHVVKIIEKVVDGIPSSLNIKVKKVHCFEILFGDLQACQPVVAKNTFLDERMPAGSAPSTRNRTV